MKKVNYIEALDFIDKKLNKVKNKFNLKILSNFNSFYLENFFQYFLLKKELRGNFLKTDFDQIEQQLIKLDGKKIDYLIIINDNNFLLDNQKIPISEYFLRIKKQINNLINLKEKNSKLNILFFGLIENNSKKNNLKIKKFNKGIKILIEKNHLTFFNVNDIFKLLKYKNFYDKKNHDISKILYSEEAAKNIANQITNLIISEKRPQKKCLVLDLDDTLWGGTIGETENKNIKIGKKGQGKDFFKFQKFIKNLNDKGVILAIASKNNQKDVKDFFHKNKKKMPLNLKDFTVVKANWEQKYKNINAISKELNIGKDSIVFFDNSKFEREQIKKFIPEVEVIEVSNKPRDFIKNLEESYFFTKNKILKEDSNKKKQYKILEKAKKFKDTFKSNLDFLKSLKMKLLINKINKYNFSRCVQMINKTNQFNLTSTRYNEIQFKKYINSNNLNSFVISLSDKFGDHGITGLIITNKKNNNFVKIDLFLLSCRILGREVENFLINEIIIYLRDRGIKKIQGIYYKTKKNFPFKDFYKKNGFRKLNNNNFYINTDTVKKDKTKLFRVKYERN